MVPRVDDSEWPIVRISYGSTIELDEIAMLEAQLWEVFKRRGPLVSLADIGDLSVLHTTALHRQRIAEAADRLSAKGVFVAEAVVIRNTISRALYVGYNWMRQGKQYPSQAFASEGEALAWAREQLTQ